MKLSPNNHDVVGLKIGPRKNQPTNDSKGRRPRPACRSRMDDIMGIKGLLTIGANPPVPTPPENKALLRDY